MPTAPSVETLYQFEDEIESAIVEMFDAIPFNCYRQQDTDNKATPFVAVQLVMGAEQGRTHTRTVGSTTYYMPDFFSGTLNLAVVTGRNQNAASHVSYVAKVRRYMAEWTARLTSVQLRYHQIARIDMQSTAPNISAEQDHDMTMLSYAIEFEINKNVWPAT